VFGETLVSVLAKSYVPLKSLIACFVFTAQLYTKRDIINQTSLKFRGVFFQECIANTVCFPTNSIAIFHEFRYECVFKLIKTFMSSGVTDG